MKVCLNAKPLHPHPCLSASDYIHYGCDVSKDALRAKERKGSAKPQSTSLPPPPFAISPRLDPPWERKVKHQPEIINAINHATRSMVPGTMLWLWQKMMNMNDWRTSGVYQQHLSHRLHTHRGGRSALFTELNTEHMRISGVRVCVCVVRGCVCVHHLSSNVRSTVCLCMCSCVWALRRSGLLVLMRGEGRQ